MNIPIEESLYVLIACEESQAEVTAFRELGAVAYSCDIQPCIKGGHPEWHIHGDVTPFLQGRRDFVVQTGAKCSVHQWDLIIAHPPCTYLCKVSSVWMKKPPLVRLETIIGWEWVNPYRYTRMLEARKFFELCLNARARYVAVENPLPMARAGLPSPTTFACPSWYGFKYTKKTLYWLRNLPPLMPEQDPTTVKQLVRCSRGKYRSRTPKCLAQAIARQWTQYILDDRGRDK